jgi:hypothetical protein
MYVYWNTRTFALLIVHTYESIIHYLEVYSQLWIAMSISTNNQFMHYTYSLIRTYLINLIYLLPYSLHRRSVLNT